MQPPTAFAIDFDAIRIALVRATEQACELDQGHVVVAEPEVTGQMKRSRPFLTIKITTPAARYGSDSIDIGDDGRALIAGPRAMTVSFNCYARSHEEAYNYLALMQARLDGDAAVALTLGGAGVSVWRQGAIADLSQLVNTAYEGRAHMDVTFGIASNLSADLGIIEKATIVGAVNDVPITTGVLA